jgi:hypothetical protein
MEKKKQAARQHLNSCVGVDEATPVTEDYKERDNAFTGRIVKVTVALK